MADPFLDGLRTAKLGRFKVFLGMAAGVGKTVAMLRDHAAHLLAEGGGDIHDWRHAHDPFLP